MWLADDITIEIEDADHPVMIAVISTPAGVVDLIGEVSIAGGVLTIDKAHIQGLHPGALGRAGLNAIGQKLLVEADVAEVIIQGGTRTTGRRQGKRPEPFRFPHKHRA